MHSIEIFIFNGRNLNTIVFEHYPAHKFTILWIFGTILNCQFLAKFKENPKRIYCPTKVDFLKLILPTYYIRLCSISTINRDGNII